MINLFIDGLVAVAKSFDRVLTAADGARRPVTPPTVDDVRPAGVIPPETGPGGHPQIRDTSELLATAAGYIRAYRALMLHDGPGPYLELLNRFGKELDDRAASLAAVGD